MYDSVLEVILRNGYDIINADPVNYIIEFDDKEVCLRNGKINLSICNGAGFLTLDSSYELDLYLSM